MARSAASASTRALHYGAERYDRLVALKDKCDPMNLFALNQNIRPSNLARDRRDLVRSQAEVARAAFRI